MPTPKSTGTLAASGGEDTLDTVTDPGNYVLKVDSNAMAAGDTIVLRMKTRVLSGGTDRIELEDTFSGSQNPPILTSIPVESPHQLIATLEQVAGTLRSFPWSIDEV